MNYRAMGQSGLTGFKGRLVHRAARPVADRTGIDEDKILAIVGWAFLGLWAWQTFKFARSVFRAGQEQLEEAA